MTATIHTPRYQDAGAKSSLVMHLSIALHPQLWWQLQGNDLIIALPCSNFPQVLFLHSEQE
jgi:hypothetical protein